MAPAPRKAGGAGMFQVAKGRCRTQSLKFAPGFSESSRVQGTGGSAADLVWSTFRRLVWLESDLGKERPLLERITNQICDEEAKLFGILYSAIASRILQLK